MIHLSNAQWIAEQLSLQLPDAVFTVFDTRGDDQHFALSIESSCFQGLSRVACHQAVYKVLDNMRQGQIHALSIEITEKKL